MKIELEIPDWAFGKPIYIVAGKELLAYQEPFTKHKDGKHIVEYGPMKKKISRCNGCGICCVDCVFVRSNGCPFGEQIPLKCAVSDCSWIEECSEVFR